jgi:hypothetical protein
VLYSYDNESCLCQTHCDYKYVVKGGRYPRSSPKSLSKKVVAGPLTKVNMGFMVEPMILGY